MEKHTAGLKLHPEFKTSTEEDEVYLLSSDGFHFPVPSVIIRTASGFFRSTLGLPQVSSNSPTNGDNSPAASHDKEAVIVPMPEPSSVVAPICHILCFHSIDPTTTFTNFKSISEILYAAEKYELHGVISFIRATIAAPRFQQDPLRLYALTCRYNWATERKEAARQTLDLDLTEKQHAEALKSLDSCKDLLTLMQVRWTRKAKFKEVLDSDRFAAPKNLAKCVRCSSVYLSMAWREFKWIMLNDIDQVPSGKTIKAPGYFDKPEAAAALQMKCTHCSKLVMEKDVVVSLILTAIDSLPFKL